MEIDLTPVFELWKKQVPKKTIISGSFVLDKKTMITLLGQDFLIFQGFKCKIPEKKLLKLLFDERFGSTDLDLEVIDNE